MIWHLSVVQNVQLVVSILIKNKWFIHQLPFFAMKQWLHDVWDYEKFKKICWATFAWTKRALSLENIPIYAIKSEIVPEIEEAQWTFVEKLKLQINSPKLSEFFLWNFMKIKTKMYIAEYIQWLLQLKPECHYGLYDEILGISKR